MVKIGSAVHTAHGLGKVTEVETVRGRTSYKVAGTGFAVWLDETKVAALGDVDESNSTTLPYDYTPQHESDTLVTDESTLSPDHSIDTDERTSPTNSVTGESESLDTPGPSADLFAKSSRRTAGNDWPSEYDLPDESDYTTEELAEMGAQHDAEAEAMYREYLEDKARERHHHAAGGWGDVDVDGGGYEGGEAPRHGSYGHYLEYAHRNGLRPDDRLTADRYSREHGVPFVHALDYASNAVIGRTAAWDGSDGEDVFLNWCDKKGVNPDADSLDEFLFTDEGRALSHAGIFHIRDKYEGPLSPRTSSIHEAYPGKHRKAPEPEGYLPGEVEIWDAEDWDAAHPSKSFDDPREQARYDEWAKHHLGDSELFDRALHTYEPIYANHRPAGLSDKFIDLPQHTAAADNVVEQFRRDPLGTIQRTAYLVESSTGLDPRMAQYMDLVEADPMIREAAWNDVRAKAQRLRREGRVKVYAADSNAIYANVEGDNGNYDVMILTGMAYPNGGFSGGKHAIANWKCDCEWGKWAFKRKITFVGRLCSHGYATYLEQQKVGRGGKNRKRAGIVDDFKDWVRDVNKGHTDIGAADDFLAQYPGTPTADEVNSVIEYAHDNPVERPERNYESGYTFDPDEAYKTAAENPPLLNNIPDRITPDYYVVPEGEDQKFIDVESDERQTTGPDQITKDAKVDKSWAKKHNELEEHDPIVRFSARKMALTYTADENLIQRLRDLSAESPSESYGNKAERNAEVAEVVSELRERGYDASQFVAMRRGAGVWDDVVNFMTNGPGDNDNKRRQERAVSSGVGDAAVNGAVEGGILGTDALNKGDKQPTPAAPVSQKGPAPAAPAANTGGGGGAGGDSGWRPNGITDPIGEGDYKIQRGDTLTSISDRSGVSVDDLMKGNSQITNKDLIFADDTMKIPGKGGGADAPAPAGETTPAGGVGGATPPQPDAGPPPDSPDKATFAPAAGGQATARRFYAEDEEDKKKNNGGAGGAGPTPAKPDANTSKPATDGSTEAPGPGKAPVFTTPDGGSGKTSPRGVEVPKQGPGMDQTPATGSAAKAPKEQTLEDRMPVAGESTATGGDSGAASAAMGAMSPALSGLASGVAPLIGEIAGPAISGLAGGLGGSLGSSIGDIASGVGGALGGLFSFAAADNYGPTDSEPDPSFAGTGPYIKDWWTTSADYIEEHERPDFIDLTDDDGDITSYQSPRQQPKQANWDEKMVKDWVKRHDPHFHDDDKEEIRFIQDEDADDHSDIVAAFQRNAANSALAGPGGGGNFSDDAIASAAQGFLRTAGRVYSLAEQQELIDESHPKGARNLSGLDLRGTHYLEG